MASRNYHKRRTKERKARQRAQRGLAEAAPKRRALTGLHRHHEIMMAAAATQMGMAVQAMPPNAPKMFVREGKPVPFDAL